MSVVIVGLGYVGLPLAQGAARAGLPVVGLDRSVRVVDLLNSARSHVDDLSDGDIAEMLEAGFRATSDPSIIRDADTVAVCVPTPLSAEGGPDLTAVLDATRDIGENLTPGTLVILESTTYPGTTDEVMRPLLEELSGLIAGEDFHLAYSPERIDPGNTRYALRNTPKVVGGDVPASGERARAFYARFIDEVVVASGTREAEAAKLLENTYRHVNIALVNELARIFRELNVDVWEVIRLAQTKPFGFQAFFPGPGVGGHCIPIDPNYLSHHVRTRLGYSFRFIELAQEINASMPSYVVSRIQDLLNQDGLALRGSRVLLVGVTYKPDIADQRESPAIPLAELLLAKGADLSYHDPHVQDWSVEGAQHVGDNVVAAAGESDVTVLLQNHALYDLTAIVGGAKRFLDTRGATDKGTTERL